MLALQYAIPLDDATDMALIRRRVRERAPAFDALPGLVQKAWLCNDRRSPLGRPAPNEPSLNEYGTFYLWRDEREARDFLLGDLFRAVVESFGRPAVRLFPVLEFGKKDTRSPPVYAVQEEADWPTAPLTGLAAAEQAAQRQALHQPGLHSRVVAFDPLGWKVLRFTLWNRVDAAPPLPPGARSFEVLHVSAPNLIAG